MEINYKNYQGTIKNMAYRYNHTTGIEANELISAGNEEFIRIQKTFDSSKSCFNTYLYWKLRGLFLSMAVKNRKQAFSINKEISKSINPEKICIFADLIKELPNDAKEVVKIIFETPAELMDMLPKKQPRGINKSLLTKYLKKLDWNIAKILKAFDDIKEIWS